MSNTQIADISVLENLQVTQNTKVVASPMAVFNSVDELDEFLQKTIQVWKDTDEILDMLHAVNFEDDELLAQRNAIFDKKDKLTEELYSKLNIEKIKITSALESAQEEKRKFNDMVKQIFYYDENVETEVGYIEE
jgi:hypothetical protein